MLVLMLLLLLMMMTMKMIVHVEWMVISTFFLF